MAEQNILGEFTVPGTSEQERRDAAISLAEAALRKRRWKEPFRHNQLRNVLEAMDLTGPKQADEGVVPDP